MGWLLIYVRVKDMAGKLCNLVTVLNDFICLKSDMQTPCYF